MAIEPKTIPKDCDRIQWSVALTSKEAASLARLVSGRPEVNLSAMYSASLDLHWLRELSGHQSFDFFCWKGFNPEQLRLLPVSTMELGIRGFTEGVSLEHLSHLGNLDHGWFEGVQKGYELLTQFPGLQRLMVRETRKLDATHFSLVPKLWSLDIKLGSLKNPERIGDCIGLKHLEVWMSSGLRDVKFVSSLINLQFLFLEALAKVEPLPDMSKLKALRRAWFQGLHSVTDLKPILLAERLDELAVLECRSLTPESFQPLAQLSPRVKVMVGMGSKKRDAAVETILNRENSYIDKFKFDFE